MNDFMIQVTTDKGFDEVVTAIGAETAAHGFRVLYTHDYQAILTEKGFARGPLKIIEVCQAGYAHEVLQREAAFSLMMPCRISVYEDKGKTIISTLRPTALLQMFNKPELQEFADKVEVVLSQIIENSK